MGQFVELMAADGTAIRAWAAEPDGPVRGAVVVVQEIFGVNAHIRAVTDRFAARGFVAIAPDLFARVEPDVELGYSAADVTDGMRLKTAADALPGDGVMQDIRAAAQWAHQRTGGKVGVVGFCWGGLLTWRAAEQVEDIAAAVCYYGGGMTVQPDIARTPRVPVLAHFSARDAHISVPSVQAFSHSAMRTPKCRCMCMRQTTGLTVTSVPVLTKAARYRPKTGHWNFSTSICAPANRKQRTPAQRVAFQ